MKICKDCNERQVELHRTICRKCRSAKRELQEAYYHLKGNAVRRGKEFTITMAQFKAFCFKTNYIQGKGKTKECYSIDRIDNDRGYTIDNIRILTVGENAKKKDKKLVYAPEINSFVVIEKAEIPTSQKYF